MLRGVDSAVSKPGDLTLPVGDGLPSAVAFDPVSAHSALAADLLKELYTAAEAKSCGLTQEEFGAVLAAIGARHNYNLPTAAGASAAGRAAFFRSLHLQELALAHACALGREPAWQRFFSLYRGTLVRAAAALCGSAASGEELADSLYADLYGLRERAGKRTSPLASYSGRGSLAGWLRATLVQRYQDQIRRTRREAPLEDFDAPATQTPMPVASQLSALATALASTFDALAAEDRYLLAAYYLDRQTLLEIARTLSVHEATVSRRLKRLVTALRKQLIRDLRAGGLSKAAVEEALGADPRDLEINLRSLLQTSELPAFSSQEAAAQPLASDPR